MDIEFDPVKDELNKKAHCLSLLLASELDWSSCFSFEDDRFCYGEQRFNAVVPKGDRLYHVTYTYRGDVMRVISLRYAQPEEVRRYVRNLSNCS